MALPGPGLDRLPAQEPPTRRQRLGPTVEQATYQQVQHNPFARFQPEAWISADLPIEEARPRAVPRLRRRCPAGVLTPRPLCVQAATPPSSWYHSPDVWELEKEAIFSRQWSVRAQTLLTCAAGATPGAGPDRGQSCAQYIGHSAQLKKPGDYLTGDLAGNRYIVCMDEVGGLPQAAGQRRRSLWC